MKFVLHALKAMTIFVSLMVMLVNLQSNIFAESRLFVPDYRFGAGFDTQLLITNTSDRDSNVDLWAFVKTGELLGREQLQIRAHSARSLTLSEAFGPQSNENAGWLAAVSSNDGIQMSYNLLGENTESRDAQGWPARELALDIQADSKRVVRLSNMGSVANTVAVRGKDEAGRFLGLQELSIGPFQQIEVPLDTFKKAPTHIDVLATNDVLASVGERQDANPSHGTEKQDDGENLALIVDSKEPVGAYQVLLRFDPNLVHLSQEDITRGLTAGFESKPLVIGIDNAGGMLRVASFQIGNAPEGRLDLAHIRTNQSSTLCSSA